jgi:hypothetical protein
VLSGLTALLSTFPIGLPGLIPFSLRSFLGRLRHLVGLLINGGFLLSNVTADWV